MDFLSKYESYMLAIVVHVLSTVSLVFVAMRLNSPLIGIVFSVLTAIMVGITFFIKSGHCYRPKTNAGDLLFCGAFILIFFAFLSAVFASGYILPGHDPIAVPLLAKTISNGQLSLDAFARGSSAYSYPPGYPIIFAPIMAFLPSVDAYFIFKIFNIVTIVLIPVTWTWMQRRLFPLDIPAWQMILAGYLMFFGVERTIGFALPFAGKNAVLLGILLIPLVVVMAVHQARTKWGWLLMVLPVFGLILVHYTMLHMLAALLGAFALISLAARRITWMASLRIALMGAIPAGFILIFLSEALVDPRASSFKFEFISGLTELLNTLFAKKSFIVIYMDTNFGISGFPYRGLALILCTLFSVAVSYFIRMQSLRDGAMFYFVAFAISLAMTLGIIPSGLARDYARWFIWAIQAAIFFHAFISLLCLAYVARSRLKIISRIAVFIISLGALAVIQLDNRVYKRVNEAQKVSRSQLIEMQSLLLNASSGKDCFIISDSKAIPALLVTIQPEKVWEYAESATSCQFVNGSWMHFEYEGGRDFDGFPSAHVFKTVIGRGAVIFLGAESRLKWYAEQLEGYGVSSKWNRIGGTDQFPAWKFMH